MTTLTKSRKQLRRRSWWNNNILGVIVTIMIAAYFAVDLEAKKQNREEHKTIISTQTIAGDKYDNQIYTICIVLVNDPNTDPMLKGILLDYIKGYCITRSGGV
jgi:hypothetical protein